MQSNQYSGHLNLLTIENLSEILHKSVSSIQSDLCRAPHRLPPMVRLPGTRRLLFRPSDVEAWINGHVVLNEPQFPPRLRGRPSKKDQIERARLK